MQIIITAEQIKQFRVFADPLIVPLLLWIGKRTIARSRTLLHEVVTDNANRIRTEMIDHFDEKLSEHLESDRQQFRELRTALNLPERHN